jgi:hypothetical protein
MAAAAPLACTVITPIIGVPKLPLAYYRAGQGSRNVTFPVAMSYIAPTSRIFRASSAAAR